MEEIGERRCKYLGIIEADLINEKEMKKKKKSCMVNFMRNTRNNTCKKTWSWLRKADSKIQTEALICAGQKQAPRINHVTDTMLTARPCESPPYVGN